jgi:predicted dienelactone hydrolase
MPILRFLRLLAAAVAATCLAGPAAASVGFRVMSIPDPAGGQIEVGVWYPAEAPAKAMPFGLGHQTVAAGAPIVGQRLPLVVMSHGNGGFFGGHFDTAEALVEAGFVAAALTHTGDNYKDQSRATDMPNRPRQLSVLIDYMLNGWPERGRLDPDRVGAFGFSSGGFTVLSAAGATADRAAILDHCAKLPDYFDCRLSAKHPPADTWPAPVADHRIKAIVSAAPAIGYSFTTASLQTLTQPIQLWQAEHDRVLPKPLYAEAVRDRLPKPPEHHLVKGADHYDFLPACERPAEAPEICAATPGFDRAAFHRDFNREVVRFFSEKLQAKTN